MISVLLLDDHALVRMGYRLILQQHLDIAVIGGRYETELKLVFALKIEHNQAL